MSISNKLSAVENLFEQAWATFSRFPAAISVTFLGTIGACAGVFIENNGSHEKGISEQLAIFVMLCIISLPLFVAYHTLAERRKFSLLQTVAIGLGILAFFILFRLWLPIKFDDFKTQHIYTCAALFLTTHLVASYAPFIGRGTHNGFWQFNKTFFLRFLLAVLYSGVLYVGLSLALLSIKNLFNFDISFTLFVYLFIFLGGLFNTWFFLAGAPSDYEALDSQTVYPNGLRIFTQFVLIPIVSIYLIILYIYFLKILFTWTLPQGWVCYLVFGFSLTGIFALLLVFPIQFSDENKWIKTYTRGFYLALLPLIGLMTASIFTRIAAYGLTENRYVIVILAIWLAFIALWQLFSKQKSIKIIPISMSILALLTCFGPWSAVNMSLNSQIKRFKTAIESSKLTTNGKIDPEKIVTMGNKISSENQEIIRSVVMYIENGHDLEALKPYFIESFSDITTKSTTEGGATDQRTSYYYIIKYLKINDYGLTPQKGSLADNFQVFSNSNTEATTNISGFDFISVPLYLGGNTMTTNDVNADEDKYKFEWTDENKTQIDWYKNDKKEGFIDLKPLTEPYITRYLDNNLDNNTYITAKELQIKATSTHTDIRFDINQMEFKRKDSKSFEPNNISFRVLIHKK